MLAKETGLGALAIGFVLSLPVLLLTPFGCSGEQAELERKQADLEWRQAELESGQAGLERVTGQLRTKLRSISTEEVEARVEELDEEVAILHGQLGDLSKKVEEFNQIVNPTGIEAVTIARVRLFEERYKEFEGSVQKQIDDEAERMNRLEGQLDGVQFSIWAILASLIAGLFTVVVYLGRKISDAGVGPVAVAATPASEDGSQDANPSKSA